jgi:dienelactone hydrolase
VSIGLCACTQNRALLEAADQISLAGGHAETEQSVTNTKVYAWQYQEQQANHNHQQIENLASPTLVALCDAGTNYINVEISEADHGFFCDARSSYNPVATSQAWPLVIAFLDTYTSRHEQAMPASS